MGWAGGQGIDEVLRSRAVSAMRRVVVVLASVVVYTVGPAWSQVATDVTVEQLVETAIANNPELRAARAEIDAATARVRQAGLRPNPMVELGGQKAPGPDNNLNVGLTVPLDLNGRKEGRVSVAEEELAVRRAQLVDRERRLRSELRMKAGEALAARRSLTVTDDLLRVSREGPACARRRPRLAAECTQVYGLANRRAAGRESGQVRDRRRPRQGAKGAGRRSLGRQRECRLSAPGFWL